MKPRAAHAISRLRAEILACYLAPKPEGAHDLRDRAVMVGGVARWLARLGDPHEKPWSVGDFARFNEKYAEVGAELEKMLAEGVVTQPHPDFMDHHRPPPDTYNLTALGAAQAMAVLAASTPDITGQNPADPGTKGGKK